MSLPNAITREDFYLNKIANPSDDHELPDAITRTQHYLKAIAENGGGENSKPFIYSETERVVGEWIDGKPLYQKTISCGSLPNATTKTVAHGISNIDVIVYGTGYANSTNTGQFFFLPFVNDGVTGESQVMMFATSSDIILRTSVDRSMFDSCFVTLRYTKNTDT